MIPVYNLKAYTEKESGFTPTSFALAQIVEASASLIDEYIEHNDMSELSAIEKVYLNTLIKENNKLVDNWSKYGDASGNWREEIKQCDNMVNLNSIVKVL